MPPYRAPVLFVLIEGLVTKDKGSAARDRTKIFEGQDVGSNRTFVNFWKLCGQLASSAAISTTCTSQEEIQVSLLSPYQSSRR